ncbi:MAG: MFS transporter [Nitrospinota bacterium]|nr:MFS transporter [Nitrospinota bacterium]
MKHVPRTVFTLGLVSLFTDISAEMIYPLLPLFLTSVLGAGAAAIGIIEGVAEATASLLKVFSGIWSDRVQKRKPLILAGYGLAGAVRPLIAFASTWFAVLMLRFFDRIGKGIRTSPRDALIADVTHPESRGSAYGIQRAMDHSGAVIGPLIASAILTFTAIEMRSVFLLAAIPAAISFLILLFGVKEEAVHNDRQKINSDSFFQWRSFSKDFKRLLAAILIFTLGNSTDAFLLLRLYESGVQSGYIAVLWSAHHVVKAVTTYYGGLYTDRLGRRFMILAGWLIYTLVYFGFAVTDSPTGLILIFLSYGIYFGFTEPSQRALVADLVPAHLRGTAFGYYHLTVGIGALPASVMFGLIWQTWGAPSAFLTGSCLALVACGMLMFVHKADT